MERVQDLRILEKMEFVEKKQNDIYFLIIIVCKVSSTLKYEKTTLFFSCVNPRKIF